MYSQCDEEKYILEVFKGKIGRFLDIGACDGKTGSNSLALVEQGWSGVLVEASPRAFLKLQDLHLGNEKLVLLNAAVDLCCELKPFWDGPAALGYATTEGANRAKWEHHCKFQNPFYLVTVSLHRLFNMVGYPAFDFVDIDTEGTSVDLFKAMFPLFVYLAKDKPPLPKMICIEHDSREGEILEASIKYGYQEIRAARNPQNMLLVRE